MQIVKKIKRYLQVASNVAEERNIANSSKDKK